MGTLHEVVYIYIWYLSEFFVEWEIFQSKILLIKHLLQIQAFSEIIYFTW